MLNDRRRQVLQALVDRYISSATPVGSKILVESYDRMGMTDLRDDAKRVLAKNYPGDPLSQEGRNRPPWWKFW